MKFKYLFIFLCFILAQIIVEAQLEQGPLGEKIFNVQEGTKTTIYQFQKSDARSHMFVLEGTTDGLIEIQHDNGILQTTGPLDWTTKPLYSLQVKTVDTSGSVIEGPYLLTIIVDDINNHRPTFNQSEYFATVRELSRPGIPFLTVYATDEDDPSTPNAQLVYKIEQQIPDPIKVRFFQINNITGKISTTLNGTYHLKAEDATEYELRLSVSDTAELSFSSNAKVYITVIENLWKEPIPVTIEENSVLPHPRFITQVRWNDDSVIYELHQRERYLRFPFVIDQNGNINVTEPLDREEREQYVFFALAKNIVGASVARPLQIVVNVADVNDNPPVCPSEITTFEVQENEGAASTIGLFIATDNDEPNTRNSSIIYKLLEQIPSDNRFLINEFSGSIQLITGGLNIKDNDQYRLKVNVSDEGRPALSTICWIVINVIDINDHIPIFERSNYGSITMREDVPLSTLVMEIQAWDADQPQTGSSAIIYQIIQGDPNHMFKIETNPETNRGNITVAKPLDYESFQVHDLVIEAKNPEPLVTGVHYNESSVTRLHVVILNVDEKPVFSNAIYQAQQKENIPIGTKLITVSASDPEGDEIKFSLVENPRNWLRIDEKTGDIYTNYELDREQESHYQVKVIATERNNPEMSSWVYFTLFIDDVNDNPPRLAKDYWGDFTVCYPFSTLATFDFQGKDDDHPPGGLTLKFRIDDQNFAKDWQIYSINRTAARLTMKHVNFPKESVSVPVKLTDNGKPPIEATVHVPVRICTCATKNQCEKTPVENTQATSVGMALGILFGVLGFIAIIISAVFISMNMKKKKQAGQDGTAAERETMST
ncbi:cadherin-17 [Rana temporaria]|uniref:cadherin-17 n=1 Tax=Rana temporaria TaxID=8407 RepID=UPI001AAC6DFE|nr:cadherin-17 [Rana temporaria]